ncbi:MAG TPA: class I SAM-dependent methyltransferase [Vicinamibacterales bacterium]
MTHDQAPGTNGRIHDSASAGYSRAAETYEMGRPGYSPAVIAWLRDIVGITTGRTVLEVGAGTGTFTSILKETGAEVYAVEPVSAMRALLKRRIPSAPTLAGTAADLPIRDASVDAVVCAQSFHWFATGQALREFSRVMTFGGMLVLVWNVRDETVPWVKRLSAITDEYEGDTPRFKTRRWQDAFAGSGFVEIDHREVGHVHIGLADHVVIARTLSVSFVAALGAEQRQKLTQRLHRFVDEEPALAGQTRVAFPYRTAMFAYRAPGTRR